VLFLITNITRVAVHACYNHTLLNYLGEGPSLAINLSHSKYINDHLNKIILIIAIT